MLTQATGARPGRACLEQVNPPGILGGPRAPSAPQQLPPAPKGDAALVPRSPAPAVRAGLACVGTAEQGFNYMHYFIYPAAQSHCSDLGMKRHVLRGILSDPI